MDAYVSLCKLTLDNHLATFKKVPERNQFALTLNRADTPKNIPYKEPIAYNQSVDDVYPSSITFEHTKKICSSDIATSYSYGTQRAILPDDIKRLRALRSINENINAEFFDGNSNDRTTYQGDVKYELFGQELLKYKPTEAKILSDTDSLYNLTLGSSLLKDGLREKQIKIVDAFILKNARYVR